MARIVVCVAGFCHNVGFNTSNVGSALLAPFAFSSSKSFRNPADKTVRGLLLPIETLQPKMSRQANVERACRQSFTESFRSDIHARVTDEE